MRRALAAISTNVPRREQAELLLVVRDDCIIIPRQFVTWVPAAGR